MAIEFGSKEAQEILSTDLYNTLNTVENYLPVFLKDLNGVEGASNNFDFDKTIELMERFEDTGEIEKDTELYQEVAHDCIYFVRALRDIVKKAEKLS